jgi:catalase
MEQHMRDPVPPTLTPASKLLRLGVIAAVVVIAGVAFAYVNGTLTPDRITPKLLVDTLEQGGGVHPGYRRNHAKGVCIIGYFESTPLARDLSTAQVFSADRTPVVGRLALPSVNPYAPDSSVPIRSMALRFTQANGQQWRTGMNSMPMFPIGTIKAFYEQMQASAPDPTTGKPNPANMQKFFASHPETAPFLSWVKTAKPSASFATETYNSINAFYLVNAQGERQPVRWSMVPLAGDEAGAVVPQGGDFLQQDLASRLAIGPLRWQLRLTLGNPEDPVDDASKQWPAQRRSVIAGTLVIDKLQAQNDGECRDINYDPTVLPSGIETSNDPLLAARSAAYASSYLRRTSEVDQLKNAQAPQEARP